MGRAALARASGVAPDPARGPQRCPAQSGPDERAAEGRRMTAGGCCDARPALRPLLALLKFCRACGRNPGEERAPPRRAKAPPRRIPPGAGPRREDPGCQRRGRASAPSGGPPAGPDRDGDTGRPGHRAAGGGRRPRPPAARFWIFRFPACFAPWASRAPSCRRPFRAKPDRGAGTPGGALAAGLPPGARASEREQARPQGPCAAGFIGACIEY